MDNFSCGVPPSCDLPLLSSAERTRLKWFHGNWCKSKQITQGWWPSKSLVLLGLGNSTVTQAVEHPEEGKGEIKGRGWNGRQILFQPRLMSICHSLLVKLQTTLPRKKLRRRKILTLNLLEYGTGSQRISLIGKNSLLICFQGVGPHLLCST